MQQVDLQYWKDILELVPKWSKYDVTNMNYEWYHNKKETAPSNNKEAKTGLKHILDNLLGEHWFYDQAHLFLQ